MNLDILTTFQDAVAQVPALLKPLIVAGAGAVPYIEGEGATMIGTLGGLPPVVAALAAAIGNSLCVAILVFLAARARAAVLAATSRRRERVLVGAGGGAIVDEPAVAAPDARPEGKRDVKFRAGLERYGVPGVCLLGPILLPTQFTATALVAAGISARRVLMWQGIAIAGWITVMTVLAALIVQHM